MQWRNTAEKWGAIARTFHWSIAAIILICFIVGLIMGEMENSPQKFSVYLMHKSFGLLVIPLALSRFVWRMANPVPKAMPGDPYWQVVIAELVHWGLYALMIAVPFSGWLMNSYYGMPLPWFGNEHLMVPALVTPDRDMAKEVAELHETLAWGIIALALAHAGAALYHHFIRKDAILARMTPFINPRQ